MRLNKLNGWQRLWVFTSIVYLVVVFLIAVADYPEKIFIANDDVIKNLSTKTMEIESKLYPFDKKNKDIVYHIYMLTKGFLVEPPQTKPKITDPYVRSNFSPKRVNPVEAFLAQSDDEYRAQSNDKYESAYTKIKKVDMDYVSKDYSKAFTKTLNQKRINFIGMMIMIWIIPCLTVYILGLSLHWVYRGFKK